MMMKTYLRKQMVVGLVAGIMLFLGGVGSGHAASDAVTVFAAASTTNAVTEIGAIFTSRNQERFLPSFASSSTRNPSFTVWSTIATVRSLPR